MQERPDSSTQPATATSSDKHSADQGGSCDRAVSAWLQTVNASGSKTLQTVDSDRMLVCFTHHWLPHHAGLAMTGEEGIAAPSSLAGIRSQPATGLELLGRNGGWDLATQQGKPMQTRGMRGYCCDHKLELSTSLYLGFTSFCCYCNLMPNTVARLDVCMHAVCIDAHQSPPTR